ncbi:MAG: sel1 repeat family protein, partial [Lachnospiraceae bacterium]|nr:sel1 repeat family protein [Lachnospiraceae bacterium]
NYEEKDTTGPDDEYGDQVLPDEVDESDTDTSNYIVYSSKFTLKWSKKYKAARVLLYNKDSELVDYLEAEQLLLSEPDNVLSIYELGKLYSTDKLGSKDGDKSDKLYSEALTAFLEIEPSAGCISPFESKNINTKTVDMRSYVWYRIGKMYCHGLGDKKNDTEALKWFEKSAVAGNKYAEFSLGSMFYYGNGVRQDYKKALEWYIKSADKGNPYAAYAVAQMYTIGEGTDKSFDTAYFYYNQALSGFQKLESEDQADEVILYKIGRMYMKGLGTTEDIPKAMQYLIRASQLGEKNAKRFIAQEYISGVIIPQDIEKGVEILTKLANYGDKMAAYRLGKMYYDGDAVFHDYNQAEKYLRQASYENEYAMYVLANLYLKEEKKNVSEAVRLLNKACGYESVRLYASYALAKTLLDDNEHHNTTKAMQILKETADKNNWCSYMLGRLYLFGNDEIEKNIDEARKWLSISSENGNQYAQKLLSYNESSNETALFNTVVSLLTNLGRIIEEDNRRHHKNISRTDQKLLRAIQRKKQELGIKSNGLELNYTYE